MNMQVMDAPASTAPQIEGSAGSKTTWPDLCARLKIQLAAGRQSDDGILDLLKQQNADHPLATDEQFAPAFKAEFNKQYGEVSLGGDEES